MIHAAIALDAQKVSCRTVACCPALTCRRQRAGNDHESHVPTYSSANIPGNEQAPSATCNILHWLPPYGLVNKDYGNECHLRTLMAHLLPMKEQDILVAVGRTIREFRKEAGLTQPQLADKVGVSLDTIGNIERGEFFTAAQTLFRIGQVLGRNMDELFAGAPRVKKAPEDEAIDVAMARFRAMLEGQLAFEAEDVVKLLNMAARKKAARKGKGR